MIEILGTTVPRSVEVDVEFSDLYQMGRTPGGAVYSRRHITPLVPCQVTATPPAGAHEALANTFPLAEVPSLPN
ncbi:hypothetical protein J6590_043948 [Homalodisca vitripennis]|nr:hypothetical protein J6590_043948 [Homalodisca vitripennis]